MAKEVIWGQKLQKSQKMSILGDFQNGVKSSAIIEFGPNSFWSVAQ